MLPHRLQRTLASLALLAMLLLVVLPTFGRVFGVGLHGTHAHGTAAPAATLPAHGGHKPAAGLPAPSPAPMHHHDGSCPYCPLLACLLLLAPLLVWLLRSTLGRHASQRPYFAPRFDPGIGLGPRGPPRTL